MIEFTFRVVLKYGDAQAFNDEEPQRAHDRLAKRLFDTVTDEFFERGVIVEVEPT